MALDKLLSKRSIEVGHVFYLGTKYSKAMNLTVQDSSGALFHPYMGCYGVGISRLVGAVIEVYNDENGIIWPENIAPFKIGLINLNSNDATSNDVCNEVYKILVSNQVEVLYDDTPNSAGIKLNNMDLIGLPWQIIVGPRGLAQDIIEVKSRKDHNKQIFTLEQLKNFLSKFYR